MITRKKALYILLGLMCFFNLHSQPFYIKAFDFGTVENSYQLIEYGQRVFVNTATFCDIECSYLAEIDFAGNILWRTEVPDIDIAQGTMIIANDTITVTGNNDPNNTLFRMAHFSLSGDKLGPTYDIEHETEKFTNMFLLTSQYFNNQFVLSGPGNQVDTSWSLIYVVNKDGTLDSLIKLEPTDLESDIWESFIDAEGNLVTYHQVEVAHSEINYRKIYKFDENLDTLWSYTSELNDDNDVHPRGCELNDGRLILSFVNPQGSLFIHSMRAINQDGSVDWQFNYPTSPSRARYILRLKCLSNGDILGCGQYSELAATPRINFAAWLFRMSPEGNLLWERTFFELDSSEMQSKASALFDAIELENGDIMAVGFFDREDNDMLILRVDSNGCLHPENCPVVNIVTSSNELQLQKEKLVLFPNPVGNTLTISLETDQYSLPFAILDISGRVILTANIIEGSAMVDLHALADGLYIVNINGDRQIISEKFVKARE